MTDAENIGYGQQQPQDSGSEFNVISFIVSQMMARMETCRLVRVEKVTPGDGDPPGAGTVDVMPLVDQIDGNNNATPHGTVYGIPVVRPQGGKNAVVLNPQVGDLGFVVVEARDISNVKTAKKRSTPGSFRKFNLSDGIYVGGLLNDAPEQYLYFLDEGIRIQDKFGNKIEFAEAGITLTDKSGNVIEMKAGGIFVSGNLVVNGNLQLAGDIQSAPGSTYAGDIHTSGDVIARFGVGQVSMLGHIHSQPNDSHGDVENNTNAPITGH